MARLELGFQLLQLSAALLRFCAIEVDLLLGDVPYHFITSNNIKKRTIIPPFHLPRGPKESR